MATFRYWVATVLLYITIYRLDPNQQYLIQGTSLGRSSRVRSSTISSIPAAAATRSPGPGDDEIQDTTANLDGPPQRFRHRDRFDFTDLDPTLAKLSFSSGVLSAGDGTHSAS